MLSLSIKAKDYDDEAEAMSDYSQSAQTAPATLGDLLKEQMGGIEQPEAGASAGSETVAEAAAPDADTASGDAPSATK